ncbi:MAG: Homeodomain-like protein [Monoraphidium minutum]|nr:MAG: Homeodomain-like protein [Monoraphidium minutum]
MEAAPHAHGTGFPHMAWYAPPTYGPAGAAAGGNPAALPRDAPYYDSELECSDPDSDYSDDSAAAAGAKRKRSRAAGGACRGAAAPPPAAARAPGGRRPAGGAGGTRVLHRWSAQEHAALEELVRRYGTERNWALIAEGVPGRSGKQCRERWLNHIKDGIIKGNWLPDEEFHLALCHALVGNQWSAHCGRLRGRTENSIKNYFNAGMRSKQASRRRCFLWAYNRQGARRA